MIAEEVTSVVFPPEGLVLNRSKLAQPPTKPLGTQRAAGYGVVLTHQTAPRASRSNRATCTPANPFQDSPPNVFAQHSSVQPRIRIEVF